MDVLPEVTMDIPPDVVSAATKFVERNSQLISDMRRMLVGRGSRQLRLRLPNTYQSYLESIITRYGRAKSFFLSSEPTDLYNFYVPLGLSVGDVRLERVEFCDIASLNNRAVVTGSAGSGKSMLMRHLLLSSVRNSSKVPVFIELRQLNQSDLSLIQLVGITLQELGFKNDPDYVLGAMKLGHFALLLDGYDEITRSKRQKIGNQIQSLVQACPECSIIVSSRPDDEFVGWDVFSILKLNPLTMDEAVELIECLPYDEDLKSKFIAELRSTLFEDHKSFLSNPLLLSIMLLTYGQSANIPTKLSIFYTQAYQALFQRHDALKGGFQRDRCTTLDIQDFAKVFAAFSLQTYDQRIFQFSHVDALKYLQTAVETTGIDVDVSDYLEDAQQAVCLLVEDGLLLVFAHRSFQEFFVARFINDANPAQQKRLIKRFSENLPTDDVFSILYELNTELVERELLLPRLKELFKKLGVKRKVGITHYLAFMKQEFLHIAYDEEDDWRLRAASRLEKTFDYCSIVVFTVNRIPGFKFDDYFSRKRVARLAKKHFRSTKEATISLDQCSYRHPLIVDLATEGGAFSQTYLELAHQQMLAMEKRIATAAKTLNQLLKN